MESPPALSMDNSLDPSFAAFLKQNDIDPAVYLNAGELPRFIRFVVLVRGPPRWS